MGCRRSVCIILSFCLLLTLATPLMAAVPSSSSLFGSNGSIQQYRFLGVDVWDLSNTQASITALGATYHANAIRLQVYMSQWASPTDRAKIVAINEWANSVGLKVEVACFGTQWMPPEGWDQMKCDAVYNADDKTAWVAAYTDVIDTLQPYAVNCMNEPPDVTGTSYAATKSIAQFRIDYKNWVLSCIAVYTAVKPDLAFVVENAPFWDLTGILNSPRIDTAASSNVIYYSLHYHYSYDNTDPYTWSYVDPPQRAYWSASTPSDLSVARQLLYAEWLTNRGIQTLLNAGCRVCMDEVGGNGLNPNMLNYLQDVFDFAANHTMGLLVHHWGYSDNNSLTTDYAPTLSAMGQVWAENMPSGTP